MKPVRSLSQADFGCRESGSEADRDPGVGELRGRSAVFIGSTDFYCTLLRLTGRTDARTTPNRASARLPWQHHQDGQHSAWGGLYMSGKWELKIHAIGTTAGEKRSVSGRGSAAPSRINSPLGGTHECKTRIEIKIPFLWLKLIQIYAGCGWRPATTSLNNK